MKSIYRIGILINSSNIPLWVKDIIDFIEGMDDMTISCYVINEADTFHQNNWIYRGLRFLDRKLFSVKRNPFSIVELDTAGKVVISVNPIQTQYSDRFDDASLRELEQLNIDLFIRFGFRILRGAILSIARFGVWSLHHGDNSVNRGGPPAFWEVVEGSPVSGVTLQRLSEELDGGTIIGKAFTRTDFTSFSRNQARLYATGVRLFKDSFRRFAVDHDFYKKNGYENIFYSHALYRPPGFLTSVQIALAFFLKAMYRQVKKLYERDNWGIAYKFGNMPQHSIYRFKQEEIYGYNLADPFPYEFDGEFYVFAEKFFPNAKGEIVYLKYNVNTNQFDPPVTVIQEDYHLSYPFIFPHKGQLYLIPESGNNKCITVYESLQFPDEWGMKTKWLEGECLYDATIYLHKGIVYLFATLKSEENMTTDELLVLYYSINFSVENPNWVEHPKSPILHDIRGGRSAGKIFLMGERLVRPGQYGIPNYGHAIQLFEITKLNTEEYEEKPFELIKPEWQEKLKAVHTLNNHGGLTVLDYQRGGRPS